MYLARQAHRLEQSRYSLPLGYSRSLYVSQLWYSGSSSSGKEFGNSDFEIIHVLTDATGYERDGNVLNVV